jgi:DNA replication protein DnaC
MTTDPPDVGAHLEQHLADAVERRVKVSASAPDLAARLEALRAQHRAKHGTPSTEPDMIKQVEAATRGIKFLSDEQWHAMKRREAEAEAAKKARLAEAVAAAAWAQCRASLPSRAADTIDAEGYRDDYPPGVEVPTKKALASPLGITVVWVGTYGPGKTVHAASLARGWCLKSLGTCRYWTAADLIDDWRYECISLHKPDATWRAKVNKAGLLIVDEIDRLGASEKAEQNGRWAIESLLLARDDNKQPTLLMGNLRPIDITSGDWLGHKLASRINVENIHQWAGDDRRKKKEHP